jgi:O-antigen/teichoic acid export membrane protein
LSEDNHNPTGTEFRQEFVSGLSWNMLTVFMQVGIQLIYMMILARLLAVEAFAVMGVILGVIGFAEIFAQVGVGPALIQRKNIHQQHINGAFYTAVILGALFTAAFFFSADWMGKIYGMDHLPDVMKLVCFSFLISSLGAVPRSIMIKNMKFKSFFMASMISIVVGNLIVGLGLAYLGYGIWAYAWALFAQNILMTVGYWYFEPVKITSSWQMSYTREIMGYGTGSSLFNALNFLATKIDVTILPFFFKTWGNIPAARVQLEAGLYERSAYVMGLPITVMGKLSDNVLFSGMSKIQDENDRLKKAMLQGTSLMSIIIMPLSVFVMIFSKEIISIFLGETYSEAHLTLRILFAAVIFRTIARISDSLVRAKDSVFKATRIKLIYCLLMIASVAGFSYLGKNWVAFGISFATFIHLILNTRLTMKLVNFGWDDFIVCLIPSILLSIVVACIALIGKFSGKLLDLDPYANFAINAVVVLTLCSLLIYIFPVLLGGKKKNPLHFLPEKIKKLPVVRNMFARL